MQYNRVKLEIKKGSEYKMELGCPKELTVTALETGKRIHIYEEPVIHVIPLLNL